MKLELLQHAGKIAGYSLVPESPVEESALKTIAEVYSEAKISIDDEAKFYQSGGMENNSLQFIRQGYGPYDIKTLVKLGEITVAKDEEEPDECLVCSVCGSKNVQTKAWIYPNENNSYACDAEDDAWCENCDKHVSLDLLKRKIRKGKENG
jgi:hypothetical protein